VIFTGGSWAAMVLAALWFVQRAFDLSWPVWPSWPA
jgi:hypothetical protein